MPVWRLLLALAAGVAVAGCVAPVSPAPRVDPAGLSREEVARQRQNLEVFDTAWSRVNRRYFDPTFHGVDWVAAARIHGPGATRAPDDGKLYQAINAMLGQLEDEHTRALTPAEALERATDRRVRTGFTQALFDNRWVVTDVLAGSPAALAGVQPGWIVVARNGTPMASGLPLRAAEGEIVHWEFLDRADRPVALALEARWLSIAPTRVVRTLPGGEVYLRFDRFDFPEWWWVRRQLLGHRHAPGIVLDLRHNGGGHVVALSLLMGEFLGGGIRHGVFLSRSGGRIGNFSVHLGFRPYRGPLAVVVGPGTASAAEILASALKERGRAVLVGQRTSGAVLGSVFSRLPDGGQLQLSITDYLTPAGERLERNGVAPERGAPLTSADLRDGRDPAVELAVELLEAKRVHVLDAGTTAPK